MEEPVGRTNELLLSSVEKVGPLAPTGSAANQKYVRKQPGDTPCRRESLCRGVSTSLLIAGKGYPCVMDANANSLRPPTDRLLSDECLAGLTQAEGVEFS